MIDKVLGKTLSRGNISLSKSQIWEMIGIKRTLSINAMDNLVTTTVYKYIYIQIANLETLEVS